MKTKIAIPVETLHLLPFDREFSKAEAMIQVMYDIETQSEWSSEGYAKQFSWSRTKVENFLEKKTTKGSLKEQLERHRKLTNKAPLRNIEDRRNAFYWACAEYVSKYGKQMVRDFYTHWSGKDFKSGKMLFELEQKFYIGSRLATWKRNDEQWNPGKADKEQTKRLAFVDEFEKVRKNSPDDASAFKYLVDVRGYAQELADEIVNEYGVENLTGNFNGYLKRIRT